jgi:hypothetical protein
MNNISILNLILDAKGLKSYLSILEKMNRYADAVGNDTPSIRKRILTEPAEIIVSSTPDKHSYVMEARLIETGEVDYWIHVDGIAEERERFRKSGTDLHHPVFELECLEDILENQLAIPNLLK